jgi:putative beta-lysine N-acetyltransferase
MKESDSILHRGGSIIQHGHFNNRVYVMKLAPAEIHDIIRYADDLALKEGYTKIFVKVPESSAGVFATKGYISEATVPFYYHGREPAVFMGKYLDPRRREVRDATILETVLSDAFSHKGEKTSHTIPDGFSLVHAHPDDAEDIAALFHTVFETYPFPITDPSYIRETMQGSTRYFVVKRSNLIAAVASCEIDAENSNAEVTDFATGPLFRGRGFASLLLHAMESELKKEGIQLVYTICRAVFRPINTVFSGAGYRFGGMLPNNTNICGATESMNVWYKTL